MENETRFLLKYHCESHESCEKGKNMIYYEACESRNFKISIDSRESWYEICLQDSREASLATRFLSTNLNSRVLQESRENFLGLKSESRFKH